MRRIGLALLAAALASGCLFPPAPPPPRPPVVLPAPPPRQLGSLWNPYHGDNYAPLDVRAHFPGDLLTVVVTEAAAGAKNAKTDATADTSMSASVDDFFGIPKTAASFLPGGFNPSQIITAKTSRASSGDGKTERTDTLTASITVTVVGLEPNGNLLIQGDKIVRVNREDQHIILSGTVRPQDIASDNTVASTRLADARISYWGDGTVGDKQREHIGQRLFDYVWPF